MQTGHRGTEQETVRRSPRSTWRDVSDRSAQTAAVEAYLREYFAAPIAPEERPIRFSPATVRSGILQTKPRKVTGINVITNTELRHLPPKTVASLACLYTGIVRTGHFSGSWKDRRIIMFPKPGKNVLGPSLCPPPQSFSRNFCCDTSPCTSHPNRSNSSFGLNTARPYNCRLQHRYPTSRTSATRSRMLRQHAPCCIRCSTPTFHSASNY